MRRRPLWVPVPEEYAIGFPAGHRNTAGGIALGYAYDKTGSIRRGACGGTLWTTGDALRNNEKLAAKLGDEGPLDVHGLQGNDVGLVRPQNEPPFQSYFVDYDGQFGDAAKPAMWATWRSGSRAKARPASASSTPATRRRASCGPTNDRDDRLRPSVGRAT